MEKEKYFSLSETRNPSYLPPSTGVGGALYHLPPRGPQHLRDLQRRPCFAPGPRCCLQGARRLHGRNFREELRKLLALAACSLPRLFLQGRHASGAEEVLRLDEQGLPAPLLEGLRPSSNGGCDDSPSRWQRRAPRKVELCKIYQMLI
ncbi:hypothetical protein PVAP13_2KG295702 [Panicum virgatum]|uniref:Uncharacterized protein n=1 Tax=Panicum virgatum TaxID=38727 RepID=A0A8T0W6Y3_PANVG|nr:hypothetical protein PVAP13_2KG295702 [Panicum virgatum]